MRHLARTLRIGVLLITLGFVLQNCGSSDPKPATEAQRVTALMKSGAWKIQDVTVDGTNQNSLFTGLTLSFTDNGFAADKGEPVWPPSGTWTFVNAEATSFTRNDGVIVAIQEITASTLILRLTWTKTTLGPGRITSLAGQTTFTFSH